MRRPSAVDTATLGLAVCYLLNDGEELATYRASSAWLLRRAPRWVPLAEQVRRDGNVTVKPRVDRGERRQSQ
ncbi:hypothetical protein GZ998_12355 [Actinomyces sp. 594]|uniref:hypothetical protein n=1 Tax=Actinomyces sp. 594 TaxID=2057793 RepID=UPI001C56FAF6|nr:hypothetical protein [Actinomyces sp. 594]MBW3070291.1 hypothetical protein [Actinomyces sp. 594]